MKSRLYRILLDLGLYAALLGLLLAILLMVVK